MTNMDSGVPEISNTTPAPPRSRPGTGRRQSNARSWSRLEISGYFLGCLVVSQRLCCIEIHFTDPFLFSSENAGCHSPGTVKGVAGDGADRGRWSRATALLRVVPGVLCSVCAGTSAQGVSWRRFSSGLGGRGPATLAAWCTHSIASVSGRWYGRASTGALGSRQDRRLWPAITTATAL
ncbi:hypothetical protein BC828DRAFT_250265 [Blastocladiella britannica]|nr:hypothetical protein BC828DRAFT_250265 [Blastocladiella britannica]